MAWWKAVWGGTVSATELALAWRATSSMENSKPAARNLGVAGAYVEALASAGWTAPSPTTVRARCGTVIDLTTEAPKSTMRFFSGRLCFRNGGRIIDGDANEASPSAVCSIGRPASRCASALVWASRDGRCFAVGKAAAVECRRVGHRARGRGLVDTAEAV